MRKKCEAHLFERAGNLAFLCFACTLQNINMLRLGKAENGFEKTEKSGGEQVIKNVFHVTTNVAM
jgi:hypothetical protein